MGTGIEIITAERKRQIDVENFDAAHDDANSAEHLVMAAVCYALPDGDRDYEPSFATTDGYIPRQWPWELKWWKPTPNNRIKELAKAGALIAAEIDRLQRIEMRGMTDARTIPDYPDSREEASEGSPESGADDSGVHPQPTQAD